jgi:hypothetical protein
MNAPPHNAAIPTVTAAIFSFMASAGFAWAAVQTHLGLAALGPICGLSRPATFFLHCPACPAALGFALLGSALASSAVIRARAARIAVRARPDPGPFESCG